MPRPLMEREREVLRRVDQGESTAELAHSLRLTEGTIRNYLAEAISNWELATEQKRLGSLNLRDGFNWEIIHLTNHVWWCDHEHQSGQ